MSLVVTVFIVQLQKISILPHKFFVLHPLPQEIPFYFHNLLLKAFKTPPPLPVGIFNDLPWGGYGFCLEIQIDI